MRGDHLKWLVYPAALVGAILVSIAGIDRPLAEFAASHPLRIHGLQRIVGLPGLLLGLALIVPFLNWKFISSAGSKRAASLFSISVLWTAATVEFFLKRVFGRSAPSRWLDQHEFAFHWFRGRQADLESMPSGEGAVLVAALAVLWVTYPRFRLAYLIIGGAEAIGLVWLNWHFASDVIAGAAVGALGAVLAVRRY